jgi:hypothetical protein
VFASHRLLVAGALAAAVSLGTPARAHAQHVTVGVGVGVGYPIPAYGFYGYAPWAPYYQVGPYPYPYPYPFHYVDPGASLRLDVKPKNAEVYVDGYYAGTVDDFSGTFKHLNILPGEHDLTLYLDGYRTAKQHLRLTSDKTLKVKYTMEKLAEGEQPEPRPTPPPPPPDQGQYQGPQTAYPPNAYPNEPGVRVGTPQPMPPNAPPPPNAPRTPNAPPPPSAPRQAAGYGTIAIRVQPTDADVMIDGETWHGPADHDRLLVDVPAGRHAIEIHKSGYRTYVTELDVHPGETTPLNVSLRGQP